MGYTISSVRSEPIYVVTFDRHFDIKVDTPNALSEIRQMLDNVAEPIAVIYDMRGMGFSFSRLVKALSLATQEDMNIADHAMLVKQQIVASDELQGIIATALKQSQRGGAGVAITSSMEIARNQARTALQEIAEERAREREREAASQKPNLRLVNGTEQLP